MADKNNDFNAIRIGTRIRHTADGAVGRIVWANASTVKVQWDDGEKITWKRAELASKGLTVVGDETETANQASVAEVPEAAAIEPVGAAMTVEPANETSVPTAADVPANEAGQGTKKRNRRPKADESKPTRTSALDAAAKVLAEEGRPMGCQELIGAMAIKGYWTSPGGKTPAATLYSAILRELDTKGDAARFVKVGRGMFGLRTQA